MTTTIEQRIAAAKRLIAKHAKIKSNPAPRIGTAKPGRVSQTTKKKPTKRLIARRKTNTKKGFFPNPAKKVWKEENIYWVQTQAPAGNWVNSMGTDNKADAFKFARHLHKTATHAVRVIVRKYAVVDESVID